MKVINEWNQFGELGDEANEIKEAGMKEQLDNGVETGKRCGIAQMAGNAKETPDNKLVAITIMARQTDLFPPETMEGLRLCYPSEATEIAFAVTRALTMAVNNAMRPRGVIAINSWNPRRKSLSASWTINGLNVAIKADPFVSAEEAPNGK